MFSFNCISFFIGVESKYKTNTIITSGQQYLSCYSFFFHFGRFDLRAMIAIRSSGSGKVS